MRFTRRKRIERSRKLKTEIITNNKDSNIYFDDDDSQLCVMRCDAIRYDADDDGEQ